MVLAELIRWFTEHVDRRYGEVGFIVTKHDGHIKKIERIDREHMEEK